VMTAIAHGACPWAAAFAAACDSLLNSLSVRHCLD
jgi:hypothetical protein